MNDILIELKCEATIKKYEFWIPKTGLIRDVIEKLAEEIMVFEQSDSLFSKEVIDSMVLVKAEGGRVLRRDYTVQQSGIVSGDLLILV